MSSLKDKFDDYREEPQHATWEQLLKRLDAEMPVKRKRRYLLWLLPLFVVVVTTGAWWLIATSPASSSKATQEQHVIESASNNTAVKSSSASSATTPNTTSSSAPVKNINPHVAGPSGNAKINKVTPPITSGYDNPSVNVPAPIANKIHTPVNPLEAWPGPLPLKENALHAQIDNTLIAVEIPKHELEYLDTNSVVAPIKPSTTNANIYVLGFDYAPGISNIILRDPLVNIIGTNATTQNKKLRNGITKPGFSQSCGVTLKIDIHRNIQIKTGFYFTLINQTLYYNTQAPNCHCGDSIVLQSAYGEISRDEMVNRTDSISIGNNNSFTNNYSLREIPLIIEYSLPMTRYKRLSYILSLGGSYMYMQAMNVLIPDADNIGFIAAKNKSSFITKSYQNTFNGIVGLGLNYKANRNVEYSIMPEFKMALTSLSKNNSWFQEYPWQFHISFSIGKRF
jgi:hypothetical protein